MSTSLDPAAHTPRRTRDPFQWIVEHPGAVDAVTFGGIALLIFVPGVLTAVDYGIMWWIVFSAPMFALGMFGRTRPVITVTGVTILAVLHMALLMPVVMGDVMTFYAIYCAAAYGSLTLHITAVALGFVGVLVQAAYWGVTVAVSAPGSGSAVEGLVTYLFLVTVGIVSVVAVWAVARLQHARVRQLELSREQAAQAVREREQRTALAVADERARIAREMHDVVAHSLSVIIAQADGGRFVATHNPEQASVVLETISTTGRSALADMRSLLGVLRSDSDTTFGPQPDAEQIPELIERVRAAGLNVELSIDAELDALSSAQSLSVFRVVQEALTNVIKHAGPDAAATVTIREHDDLLDVTVIDDGRGMDPDSDGMGHGVTGMRERMAALGGTLEAGPLPARGYRVRARVPLSAASRPESRPEPSPRTDSSPDNSAAPPTALAEKKLGITRYRDASTEHAARSA